MPRVLLFTGKGGVGKTTCAAATALACAKRGARTLVLSTDPAHSLADAVDRPLGPEPRQLAPGLDAMEVDLYYSMRKYWGNMRELVRAVLRFQGADAVAAEELAALPGMGEGSALLWLDEFYRSGDYDVIVLDAAPTGETLTLLTLPQVTQWWLQKAFPLQKTAIKTVGFAVRKTTGVPLDRGYEELDKLFGKLGDVQEVLQDPAGDVGPAGDEPRADGDPGGQAGLHLPPALRLRRRRGRRQPRGPRGRGRRRDAEVRRGPGRLPRRD